MDERLIGKWISERTLTAGKSPVRENRLLVKIVSKRSILIGNRAGKGWKTYRRACTLEDWAIVDDDKVMLYILEVKGDTMKLFHQDSWTVFEMKRIGGPED